MIFTLVLIVHVIVCLVLFGVILIQQGKGASMGAAFGTGGSQTVFGGSGAGNFLTKITWICAVTFFATSLILAYQSSFRHSVIEDVPVATDTGKPGETGKTEAGKAGDKAAKPEAGAAKTPAKPAAAGAPMAAPNAAPAKTVPAAASATAPAAAPAKAAAPAPAPAPAAPAAPAAK
jgi:preprotein translocase subunit SecG